MASSTKRSSKRDSFNPASSGKKRSSIQMFRHGNCWLRNRGPSALSTEEASLILQACQSTRVTAKGSSMDFTGITLGSGSSILTLPSSLARMVIYLARLGVCVDSPTHRGNVMRSWRSPDRRLQLTSLYETLFCRFLRCYGLDLEDAFSDPSTTQYFGARARAKSKRRPTRSISK